MKRRRISGTQSAAIRACAGVGGLMEEAAREVFRGIALQHITTDAVSEVLRVSTRHVRRLAAMYGFIVNNRVISVPSHKPVKWCSCVDCEKAKARAA